MILCLITGSCWLQILLAFLNKVWVVLDNLWQANITRTLGAASAEAPAPAEDAASADRAEAQAPTEGALPELYNCALLQFYL